MFNLAFLLRILGFALAAIAPIAIIAHWPDPYVAKLVDWPRLAAWLCCLAGLSLLVVLAGLGLKNQPLGILIDERNRYSLSRFQISLWTLLILSALYTVCLANVVRGTVMTGLDVKMQSDLLALMGISLASFVAAPFPTARKTNYPGNSAVLERTAVLLQVKQDLSAPPSAAGEVIVKSKPADARLADLIRGEDITSATVIDLPRLQMLVITVIAVVVYGVALFRFMCTTGWVAISLPDLGDNLVSLVLISHGGYLAGKFIPSAATPDTAQWTSRALSVSQRAATSAAEIQALLAQATPGDARHEFLRSALALAQGISAEAATVLASATANPQASDQLALLEGRLQTLQASVQASIAGRAGGPSADAPSMDIVRRVQQRLLDIGYTDVRVTGIADGSTEKAGRDELRKRGVDRTELHPRQYRFFEELYQIIR